MSRLNEILNKISNFFGFKTETDYLDAEFFAPNPLRLFLGLIIMSILFILMLVADAL